MPRQLAVVGVSLAGVAVIVAQGSGAALRGLALRPGDGWVLLAVGCYALYTLLLRRRRPVDDPDAAPILGTGSPGSASQPVAGWHRG